MTNIQLLDSSSERESPLEKDVTSVSKSFETTTPELEVATTVAANTAASTLTCSIVYSPSPGI
jgi:hypothetical protein